MTAKLSKQREIFQKTSLSYKEKSKECESRIHNLEAKILKLKESTQQKLDDKDQVIYTPNYIQTFLHNTLIPHTEIGDSILGCRDQLQGQEDYSLGC